MSRPRIDWAPLDAQLRRLVAWGLSTREMACELGVSRNAVASRCTRMQLPLRRRRTKARAPRWPGTDSAAHGEGLSGQCFGGDPDPGDGGVCRVARPATGLETASSLGGET